MGWSSFHPFRALVCQSGSPPVMVHPEGAGDTGAHLPSRAALSAAAATYGPTNGPPVVPAPAGTTEVVSTSPIARARFSRPLPVSAWVPAASALRARRPTMIPFEAVASAVFNRAAAPATNAADADVPVTVEVPPAGSSAVMSTPGAAMK